MGEHGQWQPVALSCDLPTHSPVGARLRGEDLVLWRDPSGRVRAWRDRCPHRGMRLSLGFLREGNLACPYHGWRFDFSGQCVHIPAHPGVAPPSAVAVEAYEARESHAIVWVRADAPALTSGATSNTAGHCRPVRSVTVHRPADVVVAALVDRFAGFDDQATSEEQRLYRLPTACGLLTLGVQEVDVDRTALHATHAGPAGDDFLASWSVQLGEFRADLERA